MIMASSLFYNLENFSESSQTSIAIFCNLESWLFLSGISIILHGLLLRLMRVFIIFYKPDCSNNGKIIYLTDKFLFLYFLLSLLVPFLLQVTWTATDHINQISKVVFVPSTSDTHYTEHFYCSSNAVWLSLYGACS